ncbi:MAG: PilW family protein [Desulfobacterales bacterium]
MKEKIIGKQGFTLLELMIALLISTVVMIAIYLTFASQEKSQITQKQITEMQQNIRAAMHIMSSEIRLAGHDKSLERDADAGLIEAGPGRIRFDMDICLTDGTLYGDNGTPDDPDDDPVPDEKTDGPNEDVTYAFDDADDADGDGMIDNASADFEKLVLKRETCPTDLSCSGLLPFAEFIQGIRFTYFNASGNVIAGTGTGGFLSENQRDQVRSIRIAILGRTKRDIREIQDTETYDMNGDAPNGTGDVVGPFNDTFRRRLLITTIKCRNLGVSLE